MRHPFATFLLPVVVTVGVLATAVPAAVAAPATGTVSGQVTLTDGSRLGGVTVTVGDPSGRVSVRTTTAADGSYRLGRVPDGLRVVCFDGESLTTPGAPVGVAFVCWGGAASAAGATPVTVTAGGTTPDISPVLDPAAALVGTVTDPAGAPVAGVRVYVGSPGRDGISGSDGRYRLLRDGGGAGQVWPCWDGSAGTGASSAVGYVSGCANWWGAPVTLQSGAAVTDDVTVTPAASVAGRVTDAQSGLGLGGATVRVQVDGAISDDLITRTATDGTYRVDGVPGGADVEIFVDNSSVRGPAATGYQDTCWGQAGSRAGDCSNDPADGEVLVTPSGALRAGVDVVVPRAAGAAGRVTDRAGNAIGGATVTLHPAGATFVGGDVSVVTGADGRWRATRLTPGTFTVCGSADTYDTTVTGPDRDGYDPSCATTSGDEKAASTAGGGPLTVTLQAGRMLPVAPVVLPGRGGLAGKVVDTSGRPLAGQTVTVNGATWRPSATVTTASDGTWRAGSLSAGSYTVCIGADPFTPSDTPPFSYARVCPAASSTVTDDATTTTPTTTLVQSGRISGTVTDADGFALGNVVVTATATATGATTRITPSTSTWTFYGLTPGSYTVCLSGANARRLADNGRPPNGYLDSCWHNRAVGQPPTVVTVRSGVVTTGINARLQAAPTG